MIGDQRLCLLFQLFLHLRQRNVFLFDSIDHIQGNSKASCILLVHSPLVLEDGRLDFLEVVLVGRVGRNGYFVDLISDCLVLMLGFVDDRRSWDEAIDEFSDVDASFLEESFEDVLLGGFV